MVNKVVILLGLSLMVCGISANSVELRMHEAIQSEQKRLIATILKARSLNGNISQRDLQQCSEDFSTTMESLQADLSNGLGKCGDDYSDEKSKLDTQYSTAREDLVDKKTSMCGDFDTCEESTANTEFFKCYADASSTHSKDVSEINRDSNKNNNDYSYDYNKIESTLNTCFNDAQATFSAEMEKARNELSDCITSSLP